MKRPPWYRVTVALLALTACGPRQQDDTAAASEARASDQAAIEAVIQRELAASRANSADSFHVLLAADATVKPPNEPAVTGGPALRSWLQNLFSNVTINQVTYSDDQIAVSGDLAVHGHGFDWTVTPKGGQPVQEKGYGIHVLQRQADGSWKIKYDIWSAGSPPPASPGGQ